MKTCVPLVLLCMVVIVAAGCGGGGRSTSAERPSRVEIEPPLDVVDSAQWYTPDIKWYRVGDEIEVETPWYPDADVLDRPPGDLSLAERVCNATLYGYLDRPPETVTVYGTSHAYLKSCESG